MVQIFCTELIFIDTKRRILTISTSLFESVDYNERVALADSLCAATFVITVVLAKTMRKSYLPANKRMSKDEILSVFRRFYPMSRRNGLVEPTDQKESMRQWIDENLQDANQIRLQIESIFCTQIPLAEWTEVLEKDSTIEDICELIATAGAYRQPLEPMRIAQTDCELAGVFLAVRSSLIDVGLHYQQARPSTILNRLSSEEMGKFMLAMGKLAPELVLTPVPTAWNKPGEEWCFQGISTLRDLCREVARSVKPFEEKVLTGREIQVIKLLSLGLSNKEMAKELDVNLETVKSHMKNIMSKLSASGRTQVLVKAIESKLLRFD